MKKLTLLVLTVFLSFALFAQTAQKTCLVPLPETKNMTAAESSWLPGLIQSKLESNLQDYLGFQIAADSGLEAKIKKLQAQSEDNAREQADAIEIGKITTAKFALFSQIIKSNKGYSLSVSYTDLTTGQKLASLVSEEYMLTDSLYGETGAVDIITIKLADKLGIKLSDLQKKKLSDTSKVFTLDEELAISKENDEQYRKMQKNYDEQLAKLMASNDLSSIENRKRIEADKALLQEKQNSEKRRQQELEEQKKRNEEDSKLESERSIALKTQRDKISKEAAEKAEEVRKLKIEKQGVIGQINVLEAKKKALVEIRQSVEERCLQLHTQFLDDYETQQEKIQNAAWTNVELKDGKPIEAAIVRRNNKVKESYSFLLNKFYQDCDSVKQATMAQQNALLAEINADISKLAKTKTVTSLGDELKVSYGTYNSEQYGWNAYYSLYSDGILVYQDSFILKYDALAGKPAPKLETATDAEFSEYIDNTDMYNSLLVRGVPVLYFELDYSVNTAKENEPGKYTFDFSKIKVINTISGKTVQATQLNKKIERQMQPQYDLREIDGIKAKVEMLEASKNPEVIRQYLKQKIKNVVSVNASDFPKAIKNIKEETLFIINGSIDARTIKNSLENNLIPVYLDFSDAVFSNKRVPASFLSDIQSIKGIIIPDGVKVIEEKAFSGCSSLIFIVLPNSIYSIEKDTFKDCKSLTNIDIPDSETFIADGLFANCVSLSSIHIPNSVTGIGKSAFFNCDSLRTINIPDSVREIRYFAFQSCSSLTSISLPDSVTKINYCTFSECKSLRSITIPESVTRIDENAFDGCSSLISVTIPDSVEVIGRRAFSGCRSLKNITLSNSMKCIDIDVFEYCSSLTSIIIPDSVTSIYNGAFSYCKSLTNITIPDSVEAIEGSPFAYCSSLTSITIPDSVKTIAVNPFPACNSLININMSKNLYEYLKKSNKDFIKLNKSRIKIQ